MFDQSNNMYVIVTSQLYSVHLLPMFKMIDMDFAMTQLNCYLIKIYF